MLKLPVALCCSMIAGNALAQTDLYIAEYKFNAARVSAVSTTGVNPRVLFNITPIAQWLPKGLAYNAASGRLVWSDAAGTSDVISTTLTGSGYQVVTTVTGTARGAALDAQGRIYFSSNATLYRVDANGANKVVLFVDPSNTTLGAPRVDATNGHVYIGASGQILRFNLDGSNQKVVVNGVSQPLAPALDIGNGYIYWNDVDTISDFVGRAKLDGSDFTILYDNTPGVGTSSGLTDIALSLSENALFFPDDFTSKLTRLNLSDMSRSTIFTSIDGQSPIGLAFSTGDPVQALHDLDHNGISDDVDIANGAADCDNNGVPDSAQANPCQQREFLIDQGSDAANTAGLAVGSTSRWQLFQPFDVPTGSWTINEIGLDGFTTQYGTGAGLTVRLMPDNGTGLSPNESVTLASAVLNLRFNTFRENWVYAPLPITLTGGRYWLRLEGNQPSVYWGNINRGFTGLQSKSRGSSGVFQPPGAPMAFRLVGPVCFPDFNNDGFLDFTDFDEFIAAFEGGDVRADFNQDGFLDFTDFDFYVSSFESGC